MDTVDVKDFRAFIEQTELFDLIANTVLFRGQPVAGNLLPSIARKEPKKDTTSLERELLKQLKLQGASFAAEPTDLDLLVRAQHYGLKTRLLDWTSNPLAALWFACSSKHGKDVYVYALEADHLLAPNVYEEDPFARSATRVFQPRLNNARILAQQGWFTLHRYAKAANRFVPLESNKSIRPMLREYRIPAKGCDQILSSLERHGTSPKTIFPDFEGLCQYLNWKHELG